MAAQSLAVGGVVACGGCDPMRLSTQVGEHVVYHWDAEAWALEDERLCGGTAAAADQLIEGVSQHYGWALPEGGPTIEYFWDRDLASSACSWADVPECTTPRGVHVFSYMPLDTHELVHTVRRELGPLPFISEGLASRWQSGMVDEGFFFRTSTRFLSEAELRDQLELGLFRVRDVDYLRAMTWVVALEDAYGPAKLGEFIDDLNWRSSPDDVEHALQRVFGISLAESVLLAESLPPEAVVDDPICLFPNLPTFVWDDPLVPVDSIYIDRGETHCADGDLVSVLGQRAVWLFALEAVEPIEVEIHVTVAEGVVPDRQSLMLASCNGKVDHDWMPFDVIGVGSNIGLLHGRHVGALVGEIRPDGTVDLPRVLFEEEEVSP